MTEAANIIETARLWLHAEQLSIEKRLTQRLVQVRSETTSRAIEVDEPVNNDAVVVERVAVGRFVDSVPAVRTEGDVTIFPVIEEVVVTEIRLRLKEEVHLRRVRTTARHTETVTLREQRAVVTRSDLRSDLGPQPDGAAIHRYATPTPPRSTAMTETIVAVYDTSAHAEQAVADLIAADVPHSSIHRHTSEGSYAAGTMEPVARPSHETGFWSSLFGGDAGTDHDVYESSMAGGGNVVSVTAIPDHDYTAVMEILEKHHPIDIDERAASYGSTSMLETGMGSMTTGAADMGLAGTAAAMPMSTTATTSATSTSTMSTGLSSGMATAASDTGMMQLSEEQIAVGKRLINRGGTRIRRYVVETPVEESVTLHSERVMLERHPVADGRPVGDSFSEKTIEMVESAEEAVVSKTARVVEEVGLRKESTDRVETIHDTVRKEEVEIEQLPGSITTSGTLLPKI